MKDCNIKVITKPLLTSKDVSCFTKLSSNGRTAVSQLLEESLKKNESRH